MPLATVSITDEVTPILMPGLLNTGSVRGRRRPALLLASTRLCSVADAVVRSVPAGPANVNAFVGEGPTIAAVATANRARRAAAMPPLLALLTGGCGFGVLFVMIVMYVAQLGRDTWPRVASYIYSDERPRDD